MWLKKRMIDMEQMRRIIERKGTTAKKADHPTLGRVNKAGGFNGTKESFD